MFLTYPWEEVDLLPVFLIWRSQMTLSISYFQFSDAFLLWFVFHGRRHFETALLRPELNVLAIRGSPGVSGVNQLMTEDEK